MLKPTLIVWIVMLSFKSNAQYYNSAFGKNGADLKTALHDIITNHSVGTYADLWSYFYTTDNKGGNIVWDIYSDIPGATPAYTYILGANQCGTYSSEGDCYNREHVWPANYFNDAPPMYTDVHQVFPTDGWVNNKHGNLPFGKVVSTTWTGQNGTKLGSSSNYPGSIRNVFEPIDSFKGDIARAYFYTSTRYEGEDAGWLNWEMANGADLTNDAIAILLSWHQLDPVSTKEVNRNNACYAIQGNRNPFIDYPQFADCIWGTADCSAVSTSNIIAQHRVQLSPNPCSNLLHVSIQSSGNLPVSYAILDMVGRPVSLGQLSEPLISTAFLPQGMYILQLKQGHQFYHQPFIKQ